MKELNERNIFRLEEQKIEKHIYFNIKYFRIEHLKIHIFNENYKIIV